MSLAVLAEAREGIIDTIRDESPELAFKSSFDIDLQTCQRHVDVFRNALIWMHFEVFGRSSMKLIQNSMFGPVQLRWLGMGC